MLLCTDTHTQTNTSIYTYVVLFLFLFYFSFLSVNYFYFTFSSTASYIISCNLIASIERNNTRTYTKLIESDFFSEHTKKETTLTELEIKKI